MIKGTIQQPVRKPRKWLDPRRPISKLLNPTSNPTKTSNGARILFPNCKKNIDANNAKNDIKSILLSPIEIPLTLSNSDGKNFKFSFFKK